MYRLLDEYFVEFIFLNSLDKIYVRPKFNFHFKQARFSPQQPNLFKFCTYFLNKSKKNSYYFPTGLRKK